MVVASPFTNTIPSGHLLVGFDRLGGFHLEPPPLITGSDGLSIHSPASVTNQIPQAIRALDGKRVMVRGYMLPPHAQAGLGDRYAARA